MCQVMPSRRRWSRWNGSWRSGIGKWSCMKISVKVGRHFRSEDGTSSHIEMKLWQKRDDDTWMSIDLARIGELSRGDVRHHQRTQWKVVHQVRDPEWCDRLMVLSTIDRHLHHPIGVRDEIIASIHVVRFDSIHQSKLEVVMWERRRMKLENYQIHT